MISLAIDTSTDACAAAVHDSQGDGVLAQISESLGRGHAERLMEVIAAVLADAKTGYSAIGRVIVTTGPGSFTGVRVGLATARGIALGLGVEACGVSTLEAAHFHAKSMPHDARAQILVIMDARRDEAYCQIFADPGSSLAASAQAPFIAQYGEIARRLDLGQAWQLCGSGAQRFNLAAGTDHAIVHELGVTPIASIARLGASRPPGCSRPEPLYLRSPDARPQTGFALKHV